MNRETRRFAEKSVMRVAVIVPAYNEEARIHRVLRAATSAKLVDEIIVVSDGSRDGTADAARAFAGVRVLDLSSNLGKGGAMAAGVASTKADVVAFVDADLSGLTGEHIDQIIAPVIEGMCEMCVGIFRGGRVWSDVGHRISPFLSGQRALRRELFEAVPGISELRMGVEIALTDTARRIRVRVRRVVLRGVSNVHKEEKMGLVKGTAARAKMYKEIAQATVKIRKRKSSPRRPWL